jgi:hypothetical protein
MADLLDFALEAHGGLDKWIRPHFWIKNALSRFDGDMG